MHALYLPQRPLALIAAFAEHEFAVGLTQLVLPFDPEQSADLRARREPLSETPPDMHAAAAARTAYFPRVVCAADARPPCGRMTRVAVLRGASADSRLAVALLGFTSPYRLRQVACLDVAACPPRFLPVPATAEESPALREALDAVLGASPHSAGCQHAPAPAAWGLGPSTWLVLASAYGHEARRVGYPFGRRTLHWLDAARRVVTRSVNLEDVSALRFAAVEPTLALLPEDRDHAYLTLDDLDGTMTALRVCLQTGRVCATLRHGEAFGNDGAFGTPPAGNLLAPRSPGSDDRDYGTPPFVRLLDARNPAGNDRAYATPPAGSALTVHAPALLPLPGDRWLVLPHDARLPFVLRAQVNAASPPARPAAASASTAPTSLRLDDRFGFWAPGGRDLSGCMIIVPLRDTAEASRRRRGPRRLGPLLLMARGDSYGLAEVVEAAAHGQPAPPPLVLRILDAVRHGHDPLALTSFRAVGEEDAYATYNGGAEGDVVSVVRGRIALRFAAGHLVGHGTRPDPGLAVVLAQVARQKERRYAQGAAYAALAGAAGL